jgi:hypothetical protein
MGSRLPSLEGELTQLSGERLPSQDSLGFGYSPPVEAKAGAVERTTVSGVTMIKRILPVDQRDRRVTQKSLSR